MNLRHGDVVLVRIPFREVEGSKIRPVVVVLSMRVYPPVEEPGSAARMLS